MGPDYHFKFPPAELYYVTRLCSAVLYFFIVSVVDHWNRLPGEVVESLPLEILETQPSMALSNIYTPGDSSLSRMAKQNHLQRHLPNLTALLLCASVDHEEPLGWSLAADFFHQVLAVK